MRRIDKRASLEIGVNTIVILVIAMMLLGLGIGFIRGLFNKANQLPGLIDTSQWQNPPTASTPIVLTPSSLSVKGGDSSNLVVGIYNKEASSGSLQFIVDITGCTGGVFPSVKTQPASIAAGDSVGIPIIVTAVNSTQSGKPKILPDQYICTIEANATSLVAGAPPVSYQTQFMMTVTG